MQKKVIELLILSLVGIFVSISFISASSFTPTCNITTYSSCQSLFSSGWNVVMGLSNSSNAHGDLPWNYTGDNYPYVLCCSFSQGIVPSNCSQLINGIPDNKIIGLTNISSSTTSTTNAHAEATFGTNYLVNVCWNGFECINQTTACPTSYPINVFNLSNSSNAHIGAGSGFNNAICCKYLGGVGGYYNPSCNLTSATWSVNNATQDTEVALVINGTNCWSAANGGSDVSFNVTTTNGQQASWNPGDATFPSSGPLTVYWTVPYISNFGSPNKYNFIASTFGNSTSSGSPNATLTTWPIGNLCSYISTCVNYNDQTTCDSDPCRIGSTLTANKDPLAYSYGCKWLASNQTCNFINLYQGNGAVLCPNGYTLCTTTGSTNLNYCYPGNTCPSGDFPPSNNNNVCDVGDSCATLDCNNGQQGSCLSGSLCSNGLCHNSNTVSNISQCGNGYSLCFQPYKNLTYCYPNNQCPAGDIAPANSCINIANGQQGSPNSCTTNLICQSGLCSNATSYYGKCIYAYVNTGGNCSNGFLTYNWTVTWTGNQQQIPPACKGGSSAIECPAQIPLPFFTAANTVAVIALLVLIYIVIILSRKRAKKDRQKKSNRKKKR